VEQEPPEEDLSAAEKVEYVFNPLQAEKEIKVGSFYLRKGSYRAAVRRFEEAAKWDPNSAEAYLKLGEAYAKMNDKKGAKNAWKKFLDLQPDSKEAESIRRKIEKL
jgi:tetratricopeptide (TPR) repeat protein